MLMPNADWAFLTDPVCGRTVEANSPHRFIHGGALFAFCSPACRARFADEPSRHAIITSALQTRRASEHATPAASAPAATQNTQATARAPVEQQRVAPAAISPPKPPEPQASPQQPHQSAPQLAAWAPLPDMQALAGEQGRFGWLLAWREKRFAAACARSMLKQHRDLSTRYPELKGPSLYRRVVAARVGSDLAAEAVLQHAEQSFAIWPVERALNFRDVVHYLAVSEFVATHSNTRWVLADMKRVVESLIPHNL